MTKLGRQLQEKFGGELNVDGIKEGEIWFQNGKAVYFTPTTLNNELGAILVSRRKLSSIQ